MRRLAPILLLCALTACVTSTRLLRQAASLNSRGAAQLAASDIDGAEASFQLALEYNDRYAEPHNNLGLVALNRGRIAEARRHFRAALSRNHDFAEAWSNLGIALSRTDGIHDEEATPEHAADAFREALAVNPGLVEARVNLARVLLASGHLDEALTQARRLSQMPGAQSMAFTLRAEAALSLGLMPEAAASIAVARNSNPADPDVRFVGARIDMVLGATGAAREALRSLTRIPAMAPQAHALLAAIALADGDEARAREELAAVGARAELVPAARAVMDRLH